jgi:hypothetical protein
LLEVSRRLERHLQVHGRLPNLDLNFQWQHRRLLFPIASTYHCCLPKASARCMTVRPFLPIEKRSSAAAWVSCCIVWWFLHGVFLTSETWVSSLSPQRMFCRYVRSLSWNMIDFYILRNMKNVMFHYMPVVISNNLQDENDHLETNDSDSDSWQSLDLGKSTQWTSSQIIWDCTWWIVNHVYLWRFRTQASSEAQWQVPQNEMASAITDMSSIHISHVTCR